MAKTKKRAKKSHGVKQKRIDTNSFLLILSGGFLVIIFVTMFLGFFGLGNIRPFARQHMNGDKAWETIVTIHNNAFTTPVTVPQGTKVTWMNSDSVEQMVVSDTGTFDLGLIAPHQAKSYVFETPGTYTYHGSIGGMEGTIVVE